jgi:hypothetical protein
MASLKMRVRPSRRPARDGARPLGGKKIDDPEIRAMFTRDTADQQQGYNARLLKK